MFNIIDTIINAIKRIADTQYDKTSKINKAETVSKPSPTILSGSQYFPNYIKTGAIYVDKTKFILKLLETKTNHCFLSRPRRFGKSLLVSTMKELFIGNKELFKGLYIYDRYDFTPYPVIHLDFSLIHYTDTFITALQGEIQRIAESHQLELKQYILRFLIEELYMKYRQKVVILIDEYDKPIVDHLKNTDEHKKIRNDNHNDIKSFFGPLKGLEEMIQFVFITGVSKFSKLSIFSELNNLTDLTFNSDFSAITGFTQEEMEHYFINHIQKLAIKESLSNEDLLDKIKFWYNGYSWDAKQYVYAPFSISNLFKHLEFKNYWFETATPTFLIDVIDNFNKGTLNFQSFESYQLFNIDTETYDIGDLRLMPLLFQAGYLSVFEKHEGMIKVRFPNHEVRSSFMQYLFEQISDKNTEQFDQLKQSIQMCNIDKMISSIKNIMATIPYQILEKKESVYHSHFYTILRTINENTVSEVSTNLGRIDTVMESIDTIYIFEFKMKSAKEGIRQIKRKKYAEGYLNKNKKIYLIGVQFSETERNILDYSYEIITEKDLLSWKDKGTYHSEKIVMIYSHHDKPFKEQIYAHVRILQHHGIFLLDDSSFDEIDAKQAVSNADIVILLLTHHLLGSRLFQSDVIIELEIKIQKGTIDMMPVLIMPCAYQAISWLKEITPIPTSQMTFAELSEIQRNKLLADCVDQLSKKLSGLD